MGIRQSFERITAEQFAQLQLHPTQEMADDILAINQSDDAFFFSPLEESTSFEPIRSLCLEESYWELLEEVATTPLADDPLPSWPILEGSQAIGDFWMGYSPLYFLDPPTVKSFATTITAFSPDRLARRCPDERNGGFEGMIVCLEDLTRFVRSAAENNEAIVWYIG